MEKIAVVGLACLFPDAENPERFWQNLVSGQDSTSEATAAEFGVDPAIFHGPGKENPDQTYSLKGGYIRNFQFDGAGYAMSAEKIAGLDPIAQASLYVARQALQNSGYWDSHWDNAALRAKCGVILGNLSLPLKQSNRLFGPMYEAAIAPAVQDLINDPEFRFKSLLDGDGGGKTPIGSASANSVNANSAHADFLKADPLNARMSSLPSQTVTEALDLSPLSFALDAACSSSLYAVELASQYLRSGAADMMLAGAASYSDSLFIRMLFSGLQAYPDNGISCPLDPRSRGLTPADGVGMLVLKRYSDAVRDGDHIHAIVSGVGLSNDGRGKHILSPNQKGQVIAFERAYADAQIAPTEVDFVECHATGTLLGDTTELNSIDDFFHRAGAEPLVGATKANTGHLLTAAGMVSLIKLIMGMERSQIPPTINLQETQESPNGVVRRDRIVTELTPWPESNHPKRSAINAFGFGGTNAHVILEEAPAPTASVSPEPFQESRIPLAIVGMDACFGGADGLEAFDRGCYDGTQQFKPLPQQRWKGLDQQPELLKAYGLESGEAPQGAYLDSVDINPIRFKIPPNEVNKLHPQQLLMLKVADRALQDAGIQEQDNVAVIVAMETELSIHQLQQRWNFNWQVEDGLAQDNGKLPPEKLEELNQILKNSLHPPAQTSELVGYIGNIMPSRISALWDFHAPSFTLSAGEDSALKALEVAQNLLAYGHADAVLVGAVDLAGGFEQIVLRHQAAPLNLDGSATLSFDEKAQGSMVGEGAGAVVLKRLETAQMAGDRIYSVVDAVSFAKLARSRDAAGAEAGAEAIARACRDAHQQAGVTTADIGYLEVCGSGLARHDSAEIAGLTQTFRKGSATDRKTGKRTLVQGDETLALTCALGSATANIGHTGVAAAIASLIKTSLCLYHRYIPVVPQWSAPKQPQAWEKTPFYVAAESRGWCLDSDQNCRRAGLSHISVEGIASHVVLSEVPAQRQRPSTYLETQTFQLFPIAARDRADLETKIAAFEQALENSDSLAALAQETYKAYQQDQNLPYTLTLVGDQKKKLLRDAGKALKSVGNSFETGKDWQTPGGSYFTANPQGHPQGVAGQVAFVYPGAFGCYVGQARDRFRLFPDIHHLPIMECLGERMDWVDRVIYPRSLKAFSRREIETLDNRLLADPITMFESEIGCSGVTTAILQDYFNIQPHMAMGYSLGETSMMLSQRIIEDQEVGKFSGLLNQSSLFSDRLSGSKNAVRDHWGLSLVEQDDGLDLWSNYVLVASPADVKAAVAQFERVYLTQINTANEVVIAGQPASCKQVIELLKCNAFRAPFNHVIHCPAMASEHSELVRLNAMTLKAQRRGENAGVKLYSAAEYQPVAVEREAIADAIATNLCNTLDFPRLVNQVYNDGARIFLEVGAGMTCARWISQNLGDRVHLATSFNRRGMNDHVAMVQALAKLVSHRVPLDLTPLYGEQKGTARPAMVKTVPLGGPSITETILSEENRAKFKDVRVERSLPKAPVQPVVKSAALSEPAVPEAAAPGPAAPGPAIEPVVEPTAVLAGTIPTLPSQLLSPQPPSPQPLPAQPGAIAANVDVPLVSADPATPLNDSLLQSQVAMGMAHGAFIQNRQASLQNLKLLIEQQLEAAEAQGTEAPTSTEVPASDPSAVNPPELPTPANPTV